MSKYFNAICHCLSRLVTNILFNYTITKSMFNYVYFKLVNGYLTIIAIYVKNQFEIFNTSLRLNANFRINSFLS